MKLVQANFKSEEVDLVIMLVIWTQYRVMGLTLKIKSVIGS